MANQDNRGSRKRRTRQHVIADIAVNHVESYVLRAGFTMHRIIHDYGLDAAVTTYSREGEIESGVIWLQIKATDRPQVLRNPTRLAIRVERRDLLSWMRELYPVIVVIYDAAAERAFWLHIQAMLRGGKVFEAARSGASLTLHASTRDMVTEDAVKQWRRIKEESLAAW